MRDEKDMMVFGVLQILSRWLNVRPIKDARDFDP